MLYFYPQKVLTYNLSSKLARYDKSQKVVDFLHPDELRAALPLTIGRQGCSEEELQSIRWTWLLSN